MVHSKQAQLRENARNQCQCSHNGALRRWKAAACCVYKSSCCRFTGQLSSQVQWCFMDGKLALDFSTAESCQISKKSKDILLKIFPFHSIFFICLLTYGKKKMTLVYARFYEFIIHTILCNHHTIRREQSHDPQNPLVVIILGCYTLSHLWPQAIITICLSETVL